MKKKIHSEELTAYALGELGPKKRKAIDEWVKKDSALQKEVQAIQKMARQVASALGEEPLPPSHEAEFLAKLDKETAPRSRWWESLMHPIPQGFAAAGLVGLGVLLFNGIKNKPVTFTVMNEETVFLGKGIAKNNLKQKSQSVEKVVNAGGEKEEVSRAQESSRIPLPAKKTKVGKVQVAGRQARFRSYPQSFYKPGYKDSFVNVSDAPRSLISLNLQPSPHKTLRESLLVRSQLPAPESIHIEEMVHYFEYDDPTPKSTDTFSVLWEVADSPWLKKNKLVRIAIKGRNVGDGVAIAKNFQAEVEFHTLNVLAYRLIGYENRRPLGTADRGRLMGAGQSIVALYEVIPSPELEKSLKINQGLGSKDRLMTLKMGYEPFQSGAPIYKEFALNYKTIKFQDASTNMRWAAGVAGFGLMLKNSKAKGDLNYEKVVKILDQTASDNKGDSKSNGELMELVKKAKELSQ